MKRTIFFIVAVCSALSASAQTLKIDSFALGDLHLAGSYCQFSAQHDTLLASDWGNKFWMKINGRMVKFQSPQKNAEVERQPKSKRWREVLKADGVSVYLDLVETGRGDDSAAFRGHIDVMRSGIRRRLLVVGGCGA